jgi:hypothetical protein
VSIQSQPPEVSIPPREDARLPVLEAEIETRWRNFRRAYVRELVKEGKLQSQVRETALWCIQVLNDCQNRGLNADQARELIQPLIDPELEI